MIRILAMLAIYCFALAVLIAAFILGYVFITESQLQKSLEGRCMDSMKYMYDNDLVTGHGITAESIRVVWGQTGQGLQAVDTIQSTLERLVEQRKIARTVSVSPGDGVVRTFYRLPKRHLRLGMQVLLGRR